MHDIHIPPPGTVARPAATVVLLRDGPAGLEVFLVERHGLSDVLGGAHVFPGGKVDAEDEDLAALLDAPAPELHGRLAEPQLAPGEAAAFYVAAARELFEETGVLMVEGAGEQDAAAAWALLREGHRFGEVLEARGLVLAASQLHPWSRWITPLAASVIRKRFDTRFFVAAVPPGQQARHDEREAVAGLWLAPAEALRRYWAASMVLAPPQIMSLAHLARHVRVADVLAEAARRPPPVIQPEPVVGPDGVRCVCYPGDPQHPVRERALPGPTRLVYRDSRFEPAGGLADLLP